MTDSASVPPPPEQNWTTPPAQPPPVQPEQPAPIPPPVEKKRSPWKWILGIVGALALLCCCGGAIAFGVGAWQVKSAQSEVEGYLKDSQNRDFGSAYDRLCTKVKAKTSAEALARSPELRDFEITDTKVNASTSLDTTAKVTAKLTLDTGQTLSQTFYLVKEDGGWRVCEP